MEKLLHFHLGKETVTFIYKAAVYMEHEFDLAI